MAILPGSLDYLYHKGILPCIPYEAYEMAPITRASSSAQFGIGQNMLHPSQGVQNYSANSSYQQSRLNQQVSSYNNRMNNNYSNNSNYNYSNMNSMNTYTTQYNASTYTTPPHQGLAYNTYTHPDIFVGRTNVNNQDSNNEFSSFREQIKGGFTSKTKEIARTPVFKGFVALVTILGTLCYILKRKKAP